MAQPQESHGLQSTAPGAPASAPVASEPSHPAAQGGPKSSVDPSKPSTRRSLPPLPTNPATHPQEAKDAAKDTHPAVVAREVEKTKAEKREIKGEKQQGTVVAGLEDDRLWAMLRRFDVQITHVLHPATHLPASEPDLRPSTLPNLPSHSEMLKSNLERTIAALGPSSIRGFREMKRIIDWGPRERMRTASYCAAYFICWAFGYTILGLFTFFIVLICFPNTRRWLFPPIPPPPFTPPSATDPLNKKGDESLIGNVDNKTVHRSKAEQAEEQAFEAASILQAYTTRLIFDGRKRGKEAGNSRVGEKQVESESDIESSDEEIVNKPTQEGDQGLESAAVVVGGEKIIPKKELSEKEKKKLAQREAKRKRDELVSKMTKATEDALGGIADTMERFTNALSPPAPYPDRRARFKIAGAFLVPPALLFTFVPPWIFARSATFLFGAALWGQPIFIWTANKFVQLVPNWRDYLELLDIRNSILSGVPTDAQLALHLLRVAEALQTPLPRPPPPPLKGTPKEAIKETTPATVTAEDDVELLEAEQEGGMKETAEKAKVKTKSHMLGMFKSAGKKMAGFHGDVSVDGARKHIGSKVDKYIFRGLVKDDGTLSAYPAKLDGDSGHIILEGVSDTVVIPQVSFVTLTGTKPSFVMPVDDIVEMKKSHVSMSRIALGWVSGADVEGLGLTLRFKDVKQQLAEAAGAETVEGQTMHFTRVGRREQLFSRLVAMGRQRWETL